MTFSGDPESKVWLFFPSEVLKFSHTKNKINSFSTQGTPGNEDVRFLLSRFLSFTCQEALLWSTERLIGLTFS